MTLTYSSEQQQATYICLKNRLFTAYLFNVKYISHFPIENRKASMDCLEGQHKVAENYKG